MSWLSCCTARGDMVSGGEQERDRLMAPDGEVPQTQRGLISCSGLEGALGQLISGNSFSLSLF